jgi:putative ABC transport system permease protein
MLADLTYAWRVNRGGRWSVAVVFCLLSIATGYAAAAGGIVYELVVRPFVSSNPERVMHLGGLAVEIPGLSAHRWWGQASSLQALADYRSGEAVVGGEFGAQPARVAEVGNQFFSVFGVTAALGRTFGADDEAAADNRPAVVSELFWRTHLAGRPDIIGERLTLGREAFLIVGVVPQGFDFPRASQVWFPTVPTTGRPLLRRHERDFVGYGPNEGWVGRVAPGVSASRVRAELDQLLQELNRTIAPKTGVRFGDSTSARPLAAMLSYNLMNSVSALLLSAAAIVVLSYTNSAFVVFNRHLKRARDVGVSHVLGAHRWQLAAPYAVECALVGVLAAALSAVVAVLSTEWLIAHPLLHGLHVPARRTALVQAGAAAAALSCCLTLLAYVWPGAHVFLISRRSVAAPLNRWPTRSKLRRALVFVEIVVAFVLTSLAVVSLQKVQALASAEDAFPGRGGLVATLGLDRREGKTTTGGQDLLALVSTLGSVPGVRAVGAGSAVALYGTGRGLWMVAGAERLFAKTAVVTPGYFDAGGLRIAAGRVFHGNERGSLLVNESLARLIGGNVVGREVILDGENEPRRIVGIAADAAPPDTVEVEPVAYLPVTHAYRDAPPPGSMYLLLSCEGICADSTLQAVRSVATSHQGLSTFRIGRVRDELRRMTEPNRFASVVASTYAFIGLAVSFFGSYAMAFHNAQQRRFEAGVRATLGATTREMYGLVAHDSILACIAGVVCGALLTRAAVASLSAWLGAESISMTPVVLLWSASALTAVAFVGVMGPARAFTRAEPMAMLRPE